MNRQNININKPNTNQNVMNSFKLPGVFIPILVLIVFLIIIMFLIFFKALSGSSTSNITNPQPINKEAVKESFIIIFFCLIVFVLCIIFLPSLKEIKSLFGQINSVVYVLLYTIFLILFFNLIPSDDLNKYAYIIVPITILLGIFSFYKGVSQNYIANFSINYERIKMVILTFCLLTCYIIFYNTNPGGFVTKYFGYTSVVTILLLVFAFLYTILLFTLPDEGSRNILTNFSPFTIALSTLFLIFIIIMTFLIFYYPGGFLNDKSVSSPVIILLLLIGSLWSMLLISNIFPELMNKSLNINQTNLFKRSLLTLFAIITSGILIYWLTTSVMNLSGQSGIISFILNIILVLLFLGLLYKAINIQTPSGNSRKTGFFNMIMNFILYIPCLFAGSFDSIGKFFVGEYNSTTFGSCLMLLFSILLFILYFTIPLLIKKINLQGGKLLVNNPVYTNTSYNLGTYQQLNGSDKFDYQFAISCWIFIDAAPPNMNASYDSYTSLLNFGNKPNILYNGKTNTLMITMQQKDLEKTTQNKNLIFDKNGNRIVYKNNNILLQKWNNFILNYNGGVLDIFLNGELVQSNIDVVPYYTLDNLTIGQENGVEGGICNVTYFKKPLTIMNIYYLYNLLKDKDPPIMEYNNKTIIKYD